jgi:hypothetical protein
MEGSCSTGQSPQRAVVPVEEEEVTHTKIAGKEPCKRGPFILLCSTYPFPSAVDFFKFEIVSTYEIASHVVSNISELLGA